MTDTLTAIQKAIEIAPVVGNTERAIVAGLMVLGLFLQPYVWSRVKKRKGAPLTPTLTYMIHRMGRHIPMCIIYALVAFCAPNEWYWYVGNYEIAEGWRLGMLAGLAVGVFGDAILSGIVWMYYKWLKGGGA